MIDVNTIPAGDTGDAQTEIKAPQTMWRFLPLVQLAPCLIRDLLLLDSYIAGLEQLVDAAWESHSPHAEELDAQLALARARFAECEAELVEFETFDELEAPDYHDGVSVEEQLIDVYAQWLRQDARGPFCGRREDMLKNMRGVLEDAARHPITASDEAILDAARDAYEAERARRARRRGHTDSP